MAITSPSASAASSAVANVTVSVPSGLVDGDYLVAVGFADPDGSAVIAPAGWTAAGDVYSAAVGFGRCWTRVAAGEGANWVFTGNSASANFVHVLRVTGSANVLDVAPVWASSTTPSTTHTAPAISPTGTDSLLICGYFGIVRATGNTWTPPAGMTEAAEASDTGGWASTCTDWQALTGSGPTGTKAATSSKTSTAPQGSMSVSLAVSTTPTSGGGGGTVTAGTPAPGLVVLAQHVGGAAAPGLIIRAADVTADGATKPRLGGWVHYSDFVRPVASSSGGTGSGGGSGGGGSGGGGTSSAVLLGAAGPEAANGSFAAQLTSGKIDIGGTWNDSADAQTAQYTIQSGGEWGSWNGPLDLAVGGIYKGSGDSWAAAGGGSYDSRWTTTLNAVASNWGSRNKANLYIRFAHELNGSFMSDWSVSGSEASDYIAAYQRFVNLQRSILPGSKNVWPLNDGSSTGFDFRTAYPGDSYVDLIGVDTYNQYPWVDDIGSWNSKIVSTDSTGCPVGIEAWRQFAESKGKPICFPEWQNNGDTGGGGGGGDSPNYIQWMHDYFLAHAGNGAGQVAYAVTFNLWTQFSLYPTTLQPNAWARYKSIF